MHTHTNIHMHTHTHTHTHMHDINKNCHKILLKRGSLCPEVSVPKVEVYVYSTNSLNMSAKSAFHWGHGK